MGFREDLDIYLTSLPFSHYDDFCEAVSDWLTDDFWSEHEDWFLNSFLCGDWLNTLSRKGYEPKKAANIIERAHKMYVK